MLARLLLQGGGQSSEHQRLEVLAEKGEEEGRQGWPTPAGLLVRSVKRCVAWTVLLFLQCWSLTLRHGASAICRA